ncbi:uncharacterized protein [Asterias amurensis]|uniref:uncharacterized protein n=1 Tax=Asterias amurensis TaxID=7602 RepID=UPI003AB57971
MSLSIRCLHTRPDLIVSCSKLLKSVWPCSRVERLQHLENENCTGFPCSLVLIDHRENRPDSVIGHLRIVPVKFPIQPKSVYLEAGCVDKSRQMEGLYKQMLSFADKFASETLECQQIFGWIFKDFNPFVKSIGYVECPDFTVRAVGANALEPFGTPRFWTKDTPPPDNWKFAPDGSIITKDALLNTVMIKKTCGAKMEL